MMRLSECQKTLIPQIESGLQAFFNAQDFGSSALLKEMLAFHMGWLDASGRGKRLRPLITLLCTAALGGEVQSGLPAALAVEFLHNFTLIHDDIEDRSPIRHGRETIWKRWGEAQAINAGDALFSIAQLALLDLAQTVSPSTAVKAGRQFNQTCLRLTRGQHLDIAFETAQDISVDAYLDMIQGKTGALIAFSAVVAGIIMEKSQGELDHLNAFGSNLGLAFQVQDDILGIWGDPGITGKSAASDLLSRKKTLPVLFGLKNSPEFLQSWSDRAVEPQRVVQMAALLEDCGAREFAIQKAQDHTAEAFKALETLFPGANQDNGPAQALLDLSHFLLMRRS